MLLESQRIGDTIHFANHLCYEMTYIFHIPDISEADLPNKNRMQIKIKNEYDILMITFLHYIIKSLSYFRQIIIIIVIHFTMIICNNS